MDTVGDIELSDLSLDHLLNSRLDTEWEEYVNHLRAMYRRSVRGETDMMEFSFEQYLERVRHAAGRADILENLGAITSEEANQIRSAAEKAKRIYMKAREEVKQTIRKYNDSLFEFFDSMLENVRTFGEAGLLKQIEEQHKIQGIIEKELDTANAKKVPIDKRIAWEEDFLIHRDPEGHTLEGHIIKEQLDKDKKEVSKIEQEIHEIEMRMDGTILEIGRIRDVMAASKLPRAFENLKKVTKAFGADIDQAIANLKNLSSEFNKAMTIIADGYKDAMWIFKGDTEVASEFWKEVNGVTEKASDAELEILRKQTNELIDLAKAEEAEAFFKVASKFSAPSYRMWMTTKAEFNELRAAFEASESWAKILDVRWIGFAIKGITRSSFMMLAKGAELILGESLATGLFIATNAVVELSGKLVGWLFGPEVQFALIAADLVKDLIRDGFSWQFADDVLGFIGLSLADFPETKLKEYPEVSTAVSVDEKEDAAKLHYYDAKEFKTFIDFWAKLYVDSMEIHGEKLPPYVTLKEPKVINRIPGKYIDLNNHPYDLDAEITECNRLEGIVAAQMENHVDLSRDTSLVPRFFKKKKGKVRNLFNFPFVSRTMYWPDPQRGTPIQIDGNFSKKDLDPTVVDTFMKWAKSGKYGPVYNTSKVAETRMHAAKTNREDLQQYLDPKPNYPTAWTELAEWVKLAEGSKAIMYSDMVVLAPKQFDKEWNGSVVRKVAIGSFFVQTDQIAPSWDEVQQLLKDLGRPVYEKRYRDLMGSIVQTGRYPILVPSPYGTSIPDVKDRPAPPHVIAWSQEYLAKGAKYRQLVDDAATKERSKWQQEVKAFLWPTYVQAVKPTRTVWSYIARYKSFFMGEMVYWCNYLNKKNRHDIWQQYLKQMHGAGVPLNMDSAHRVLFMGQFAQLAYTNKQSENERLEKQLEKKFKGFKENALVTTQDNVKSTEWWAKEIATVVLGQTRKQVDWPVFFGNLHCRLFVLNDPRILVIAFRGTTNAFEWIVDLDFSTGDFLHVGEDPKKPGQMEVTIRSEEDRAGSIIRSLVVDPNLFQCHRGFLRAWRALQPAVIKLMNEYYKKYPDIQHTMLTGHSLGAAIAQVASFFVPRTPVRKNMHKVRFGAGKPPTLTYMNPHVYYFSSPAVGDTRFNKHFVRYTGETACLYTDGDIIGSVPPFILPAKDSNAMSYANAVSDLKALSKASPAWAGLLWALHEIVNIAQLPAVLDPSSYTRDYAHFDARKLESMIGRIQVAANEYRAERGAGVFFRCNPNRKGDFVERNYDPGNSSSLFKVIAQGGNAKDKLIKYHSIVETLKLFKNVVRLDKDIFDIGNEDLPSWANGGKIDPSHHNPIPKDIQKLIREPGAKIIGLGHTSRHYAPFQLVEKKDVDEMERFWLPEDPSLLFGTPASRKRKRQSLKDETYHDIGYY